MRKRGWAIIILLGWMSLYTLPVQAQNGPGGIGNTDGLSALRLWMDAGSQVYKDTLTNYLASGGDRIRCWKDRSGNNVLAKINTDKQRPTYLSSVDFLNGYPALFFHKNNGINDELNGLFTDTFFVDSDLSVFCVFHPLSPGGGTDVSYTGSGATSDGWYNGAGLLDAEVHTISNDIGLTYTSQSVAAGMGNTAVNQDNTIKTPAAINQSYIASLVRDGSAGVLGVSVNASALNQVASSVLPINAPVRYGIGSTAPNLGYTDNYLDGHIASVLLFNKKLSLAEQIILYNHLSAKYAISLSQFDKYTLDEAVNGNYDHEVAGIGQASDGSQHFDSKGEGIIRMSNPRTPDNDRFLFWGHDNAPLARNTYDLPGFLKERTQRVWRIQKTGGNLGTTDITLTLEGINPSQKDQLHLLLDRNNNGNFADEGEESLVTGAVYAGGKNFSFNKIDLPDGIRFTIALGHNFTEETSFTLTPNDDGVNDVVPITESGVLKVFDRNGRLVKELTCPCGWDGTANTGELVGTGFYVLKINDSVWRSVTVIR